MGIGFAELFFIVPVAIISIALPVTTLVLVVLIHRKLTRIEEKLGR